MRTSCADEFALSEQRLRRGFVEQIDGATARLTLAEIEMGANRLDQLVADAIQRIQAGQRILKDHTDLFAAHAAHLLIRQVVDAPPVEIDRAAGDAPR